MALTNLKATLPPQTRQDEEYDRPRPPDGEHAETLGPSQHTLFVKNLPFQLAEKDLAKQFSTFGKVRKITWAPNRSAPGTKKTSKGYAFVEFETGEAAARALNGLNGKILQGRRLHVSVAHSQAEPRVDLEELESDSVSTRTKLIARNIAFQASAKEVRELFNTFGQVRTLRLPKKFNGAHRGFAFVDFVSAHEACRAFHALKTTHFYGRHLVLEWAAANDELDVGEPKNST